MSTQKLAVLAGAVAATGLLVGGAQAKEITLRGASCFPIKSPPGRPFEAFVRKVNKLGKGVVQIKLLGGAPAIGSPFTLVRRVSRGAFDIVGCPDAYYGNVMPEAGAIRLTDFGPGQNRKNGSWAYINKNILGPKNLLLLGQTHNFGPFHLFLAVPITKPNLKGLHLRVAPVYTAFFRALGATTQRSNFSQVYTYMENGTVQGFGWPALGWNPGWIKVTRYVVEPGFYRAGIQTIMNLRKWRRMTKAQRAKLNEIVLAHEKTTEKWPSRMGKQKAWMVKNGMKIIKFTGADAKKWSSTATNAAWAEVLKRSPKHGPILKKMMTK